MKIYLIHFFLINFNVKITEPYLNECSLIDGENPDTNSLKEEWLKVGQLYAYCIKLEDKGDLFSISPNGESCNSTCKECLTVCKLESTFHLDTCLSNCTSSSFCELGCHFYSNITENEILNDNKPDVDSSFEVTVIKNKCYTEFQWSDILSERDSIPSIYLVSVVANGEYSNESFQGLVSQSYYSVESINLTTLYNLDICASNEDEFQLNVYSINYNGYDSLTKLSSNFTGCDNGLNDSSYCDSVLHVSPIVTTNPVNLGTTGTFGTPATPVTFGTPATPGTPDYFSQRKEFTIGQGVFLGSMKVLMKVFTLSFNVKPIEYSNALNGILHLFLDNDHDCDHDSDDESDGDGKVFFGGFRQGIAVRFNNSKLSILAAMSCNCTYSIETTPLMLREWSTIKIFQILSDGKYWFFVNLNGINVYEVENSNARDFENVKVHTSDHKKSTLNGSIADLLIVNGKAEYLIGLNTSLMRGQTIAKIPIFEKEYLIALDIFPNNYAHSVYSWYNAINFTTGNYYSNNSVISISFYEDADKKLRIIVTNNGNNQIFKDNLIAYNAWSNIEICQIWTKDKRYMFIIKINGSSVSSTESNYAQSFDNVEVYASDPWTESQVGYIRNFFVVNGFSNSSKQTIIIDSFRTTGTIRTTDSPTLYTFQTTKNSPALNTFQNPKKELLIILVALLVPAFVLIIAVVILLKIFRRKVTSQHSSVNRHSVKKPDAYKMENVVRNESADDWEIFPDNIRLDKKIGEGAFSDVFIAKIKSMLIKSKNGNQKSNLSAVNEDSVIAVKLLKDGANQLEIDDFREEINLMKRVGYHKNIINMIGCSTIKRPLCLIYEYMEIGDLLHLLRCIRLKISVKNRLPGGMQSEILLDKIGLITPDDLLSFAMQIASGMEYLSCIKLVHKDLAARNILVSADKNVKISDFGVIQKINSKLNYVINKNHRLPIKWMSVEAIFDQTFTTYSDVWAYGIVLFEIVTLGGTPYPTINDNELLNFLNSGYRMDRPENCSEPMYDIMLHCWNGNPLQRPTFRELREHLDKLIAQGGRYFNFNVDEKNIYYTVASFKSVSSEPTGKENSLQNHVKSINEGKQLDREPVLPSNERYTHPESLRLQIKPNSPAGLVNKGYNNERIDI